MALQLKTLFIFIIFRHVTSEQEETGRADIVRECTPKVFPECDHVCLPDGYKDTMYKFKIAGSGALESTICTCSNPRFRIGPCTGEGLSRCKRFCTRLDYTDHSCETYGHVGKPGAQLVCTYVKEPKRTFFISEPLAHSICGQENEYKRSGVIQPSLKKRSPGTNFQCGWFVKTLGNFERKSCDKI